MQSRLGAYCERILESGWLAAVIVVPLFFDVFSARVFEPDKLSLLRAIALLVAAAWLIRTLESLPIAPGELRSRLRRTGARTQLRRRRTGAATSLQP